MYGKFNLRKKISELALIVLMNILLEFEDFYSTKSLFINAGSVVINSQNYCKLQYLKNITQLQMVTIFSKPSNFIHYNMHGSDAYGSDHV